ncbi:hypothetical protein HFN_1451 [Helicobacter fennelliae MRY12-0050]|uniref:Uncharacterized protein n=1 Tax=Helicobacter fennelliae MRY12-0050 TaxID=1325130 RepID=T1DUS2_9HELI|nr:hypothetical protein HFN_1451 [Helicobacter fennelliae MRY12-0050]
MKTFSNRHFFSFDLSLDTQIILQAPLKANPTTNIHTANTTHIKSMWWRP